MKFAPEEINHIYRELVRFLRRIEGVRSHPYRDSAGKWTIGIGHLLTESEGLSGKIKIAGEEVTAWTQGLTEKQIDDLLLQDIWPIISLDPPGILARHVKVELTTMQFVSLASFVFNVGKGNFINSTLLAKINQSKWDDVPDQFMRWVHVGKPKKVIVGLVNRRLAEIKLWELKGI